MIAAVLTLLMFAVAASVPVVTAQRRGVLFATDIALLLAPTGTFALAAAYLRVEGIMFGWLIYPFEVLAASALLLGVRVFVIDRLWKNARWNSIMVLSVACMAALAAGLLVPVGHQ